MREAFGVGQRKSKVSSSQRNQTGAGCGVIRARHCGRVPALLAAASYALAKGGRRIGHIVATFLPFQGFTIE
jgi:hypothetical protein